MCEIIHARCSCGRFSSLVRPEIHAQSRSPSTSWLLSQSVTVRCQMSVLVLQIEAKLEHQTISPPETQPNKKRALSHIETEPETLMEPVTGSPRIRFANTLRLRMPAGILARSLRTLRVRLTLAPLRVRFRHLQETGPVPLGNRARNSHGASDRNRTCNPLITNQLRYRCATLAHLALSREAS